VDDLIYGLIKLMGSSNDFTGPVNLGNPLEFTILELAELVIKLTHSTSDIIHEPLPSDDPLQRKPDIGLATSALNWKPQVELEQGLDKTIYYFRKILDIPEYRI